MKLLHTLILMLVTQQCQTNNEALQQTYTAKCVLCSAVCKAGAYLQLSCPLLKHAQQQVSTAVQDLLAQQWYACTSGPLPQLCNLLGTALPEQCRAACGCRLAMHMLCVTGYRCAAAKEALSMLLVRCSAGRCCSQPESSSAGAARPEEQRACAGGEAALHTPPAAAASQVSVQQSRHTCGNVTLQGFLKYAVLHCIFIYQQYTCAAVAVLASPAVLLLSCMNMPAVLQVLKSKLPSPCFLCTAAVCTVGQCNACSRAWRARQPAAAAADAFLQHAGNAAVHQAAVPCATGRGAAEARGHDSMAGGWVCVRTRLRAPYYVACVYKCNLLVRRYNGVCAQG
jgi:hypothetical protein